MDGSSDSGKSGDERTGQHKTLTPAILGIPSGPHGVKLSSNMNHKDKEQLLLKLEAWREARKEKLISTIMAKGKQSSSLKLPPALPSPKMRTMSNPVTGTDAKQSSSDGKKSVFDRLYENASKAGVKKSEENKNEKVTTVKPVVKPSKNPPFGKCKIPKVIVFNNAENISDPANETCKETILSAHATEAVPERKEKIKVERYDSNNLSNEIAKETNMVPEEEVTKVKDEIPAELHVLDSHCHEMTQKTELSLFEEECSKEQKREGSEEPAGVSAACENTDSVLSEPLQEVTLSVHVDENFTEEPSRVEENTGELKKDDGVDVKKSVGFETPKEKVLSAVHLRNKLEDWLIQKGHSLDSYRHLRCFGLNGEKTPFSHQRQAKIDDLSNSSFYFTAPNTPVSEVINESDKENVTPVPSAPKIDIKDVEGWLGDLHRLIVHVEYPSDRCEEWLRAITKKFPSCTHLPIYWECLAAMDGDVSLLKSVEGNEESEKREGEEHDTSMAELFDKLMIDEKCHSASKTERGLSMKNIFKSKTVKFALQEKSVKEMDPELGTEARRKVLVATPVRRSARLQTPDKSNIIGSLQSLDPETRRSVSFQPNEALLTG